MTHRLITTHAPSNAAAAVLVLHGGASREGGMQVSPTQLSVLRMVPIARRVARSGRGRLAVFRLLNSIRGWDTSDTPLDDARWALGQLRARFGTGLPIGLIGHSLGGRAAILATPEAAVRSVVALAPWVYPDDGDLDAAGRQVLIVHGSADRIADPRRSLEVARRLRRTTDAGYVCVEGGKHAMLRRHDDYGRLAADATVAALLDEHGTRSRDVLQRAFRAGRADV